MPWDISTLAETHEQWAAISNEVEESLDRLPAESRCLWERLQAGTRSRSPGRCQIFESSGARHPQDPPGRQSSRDLSWSSVCGMGDPVLGWCIWCDWTHSPQ